MFFFIISLPTDNSFATTYYYIVHFDYTMKWLLNNDNTCILFHINFPFTMQ